MAAGGFRARQLPMRGLHRIKPAGDIVRKRRRLLCAHVDMQRHLLGGGRNPALRRMEKLLKEVQPFGVEIEQLQAACEAIALCAAAWCGVANPSP